MMDPLIAAALRDQERRIIAARPADIEGRSRIERPAKLKLVEETSGGSRAAAMIECRGSCGKSILLCNLRGRPSFLCRECRSTRRAAAIEERIRASLARRAQRKLAVSASRLACSGGCGSTRNAAVVRHPPYLCHGCRAVQRKARASEDLAARKFRNAVLAQARIEARERKRAAVPAALQCPVCCRKLRFNRSQTYRYCTLHGRP